MEPAGVSGTVTISDQKSYIKIETLRGKNPTEIHGEVCGEFTVDRSTVSCSDNRFHGGCVSMDNGPKPRRSRTPTDERSVVLLKHYWKQDYKAAAAALRICEVGGDGVVSESVAKRWFQHFNAGEVNSKYLPRSRRSKLWNIENICDLLGVCSKHACSRCESLFSTTETSS